MDEPPQAEEGGICEAIAEQMMDEDATLVYSHISQKSTSFEVLFVLRFSPYTAMM